MKMPKEGHSTPEPNITAAQNVVTTKEDTTGKSVVSCETNFIDQEVIKENLVPAALSNNLVQNNQLRQAPIMFQGATCANCQITLNIQN